MKRAGRLWSELLLMYVGVPALMYERILPNWPIPFLLVAAIWALLVLRRDAKFEHRGLVGLARIQSEFWGPLLRDIPLLVLLGIAVRLFAPEMLFSLYRRSPAWWLAVVLFYPIFSVYPQELLYRAFFFHRGERGVFRIRAHYLWELGGDCIDGDRGSAVWLDVLEIEVTGPDVPGTCALWRFHFYDWNRAILLPPCAAVT